MRYSQGNWLVAPGCLDFAFESGRGVGKAAKAGMSVCDCKVRQT